MTPDGTVQKDQANILAARIHEALKAHGCSELEVINIVLSSAGLLLALKRLKVPSSKAHLVLAATAAMIFGGAEGQDRQEEFINLLHAMRSPKEI